MATSSRASTLCWLAAIAVLGRVQAVPDSAHNTNVYPGGRSRCHAEYGIRLDAGGVQRMLDSVRCSHSSSQDVTAFLTGLGIIQTIDMDITDSSISVLNRQLFSGVSVRRLRISRSQLENVTVDAFQGLENVLEELDLSENGLRIFPSTIRNLTMLKKLDLKRNRIEKLPEGTVFFNLLRLRHLDLSYNRLGYLDSVRRDSSPSKGGLLPLGVFNLEPLRDNLEFVSLRGNNMNGFPEQFLRPFARLRDLDLSHNKFTDIPPDAFSQMPQLENVNLHKNNLTEFRLNTIPVLLKSFTLAENPVDCGCSIAWLWNLARNFSLNLELNLPRCHSPTALQYMEISTLENFCSNQTLAKTSYDIQYFPKTFSIEVHIQQNEPKLEDTKSLQWKVSVRKFASSEKTHITQSEQISTSFPITVTADNLGPGSGYVICTEVFDGSTNLSYCEELATLVQEEVFPTAEVAVAASVSTSTTIFVVVLVCCCCPKRPCKKQRSKTASNGSVTKEVAPDGMTTLTNGTKVTSLSDKYSRLNEAQKPLNGVLRTPFNIEDEESVRVFEATRDYLRRRNQKIATGTLKRMREDLRQVSGPNLVYYLQPLGSEELQSRGIVYSNATYETSNELDATPGRIPNAVAAREKRQKYYTWATCPITWTQQHYENFLANPAMFKRRNSISQLSIPFCSMPPVPTGTSRQFYWSAAPAPSTVNLQF